MTEPTWSKGPPRRLLLATDMSARCDRALDRAGSLSVQWRAPLVAVHALDQQADLQDAMLGTRRRRWAVADAASQVEEQLRQDIAQTGAEVAAVVEKGDARDLVLRTAAAQGCDLIVTGIARDEMFGRFGLGTTVDGLLRRSPVPILVVKNRVRAHYRNVLVAVDFSASSAHALKAAMAFFPEQRLVLFHAYDTPMSGLMSSPDRYREDCRQAALDSCAAFLADTGIAPEQQQRFEILIEHGEPAGLLQHCVRDRRFDLVVLGTHGGSALFDILIGSTAKAILADLPCDALIVREPRSVGSG